MNENIQNTDLITEFAQNMYCWILDPGSAPQSKRFEIAKMIQQQWLTYSVNGGTANAVALTTKAPISGYVEGMSFTFKALAANTGAVTINVDGVGAVSLVNTSGSPLNAGDLKSGSINIIIYDGTNFQLIGIGTTSAGGGHTILDDDTPLTQRSKLNFKGSAVSLTDDAINDQTIITIDYPDLSDYLTDNENSLTEISWQGDNGGFDTWYIYLAAGAFEVSAYSGAFGENLKIIANDSEASFFSHNIFSFRNETDTAYQNILVADPTADQHAASRIWTINQIAAGGGGAADGIFTPVQDITALKALNTTNAVNWPDKWMINVEDAGLYRLDRDSSSTEDLPGVVQPTTGVGRWFKISSQLSSHNLLELIQGGTTGEYYHLTSSQHAIVVATEESFTTALKDSIDDRPISAVLDLNSTQTIDFSSAKTIKVNAQLTASRVIDTITNASAQYKDVVIDVDDPNGFGVSFDAGLNVEELGSAPTSGQYTIDLLYLGDSYRAVYPETNVIASQVEIDASGYDGTLNLESTDDTVQKVANKFNTYDFSQKDENTQFLFPPEGATLEIDFSLGTNVVLNLGNFTTPVNPEISFINAPIGDTGRLIIKPYDSEPTWSSNVAAEVFPSTITSGNVIIYKVITIEEAGSDYHTLVNEAENITFGEAAYSVEETIKINFGNDSTTSPANWNTAQSAHADGVGHTISALIKFSDGSATGVSVTSDTLVGKGNAGYDSGISDGSDNDGRITKSFHSFGNATNWASETFNDLDPTKPYQVHYLYSSSTATTGDFRVTGLDGGGNALNAEELNANMQNNSTYTTVNNVYPTSGGNITVGFRDGGNLCAIILERSNKPFIS